MKFSLCMIVKDEEKILGECLDCLCDIMDEIIIVDTGSTDDTKKVAQKYTSQVYDFEWKDDFAAARNFAFSKATGDYIYSADADELLDEENRVKFKALKQVLLPEVEIVQMIYVTRQHNHPTENFVKDLRPKLFKRIRTFNWIEPIHETVQTSPVVYDSDIEIIHRPQGDHSYRDFKVFEKYIEEQGALSDRLLTMYLRELYKAGSEDALESAKAYLDDVINDDRYKSREGLVRQAIAVLMKYCRLVDDSVYMLKLSLREEVNVASSEVCMELGYFFLKREDYMEASKWFYNAAFCCESEIDIASSGTPALTALALCYRKLSKSPKVKALPKEAQEIEIMRYKEKAAEYEQMARDWKPQEKGF